MSSADTRPTKDLFRLWRTGGDAQAGQAMAQRFADWYYAIAVSRLGERAGREPCERACARFGQGVVNQTEFRDARKWAHQLVTEELQSRGARAADGDDPSTFTNNQRPKDLLVKARRALPDEVALVELVYRGGDAAKIAELAAKGGGMPLGVLKARYAIKRWLRDHAKVSFDVVPDAPNLDHAPLPLYESGRMGSPVEEATFEQWMLDHLELCRDIAEFSHFAIALRGGLPAAAAGAAAPGAGPRSEPSTPSTGAGAAGAAAIGGVAVIGGLVVLGLIVLLGLVYLFVL